MNFFRSIFQSNFKSIFSSLISYSPFTSKASGNWNSAGNTTWVEDGFPEHGDTVTILATHIITQIINEACRNITINATGKLDIATFNNIITDFLNISGILEIATSADLGLYANGIFFVAGSTGDFQIDSKINNSGNLSIANANIFTTKRSAIYTQIGNGNLDNPDSQNFFYSFIINAGVTATLTGNCRGCDGSCDKTIINGEINTGVYSAYIGGNNIFTLGVNSEFSGAGNLKIAIASGTTITNNKVGAFLFTGDVEIRGGADTRLLPAMDISNGNLKVENLVDSTTFITIPEAGTHKYIDFEITSDNSGVTATMLNSTNNPSFEFSGSINLNNGPGTLTTVWTRGTGTITLSGGTANFDPDSQTIERLIVIGSTKTVIDDFTTASMLVSGTLDINSIGTIVVEGDLDGDGTITSPTPVNLTVNGNNNFTGTLTNVTIV